MSTEDILLLMTWNRNPIVPTLSGAENGLEHLSVLESSASPPLQRQNRMQVPADPRLAAAGWGHMRPSAAQEKAHHGLLGEENFREAICVTQHVCMSPVRLQYQICSNNCNGTLQTRAKLSHLFKSYPHLFLQMCSSWK